MEVEHLGSPVSSQTRSMTSREDVLDSPMSDGSRDTKTEPPLSQHPKLGMVQFLTLCWTLFMIGWNDSSTGPLIPRIQEVYNIGYVVVSLIFIFACLGYLMGAIANVYLSNRLGFGKTIVLGAVTQLVGYALQSSAPPYPVFLLGFVINGFGVCLQDSQANGFVATLTQNSENKMGVLHAFYGIGALASPLVATQFSQMRRWSFHYLVSLGIAVANTISLIAVFRLKTQDECQLLAGEPRPESTTEERVKPNLRKLLKIKEVHLMSIFLLIYVGVEVTIGGWIVSFIIKQRHGGPSSGYISSGFFGGLTLGRVALLWVNKTVGERRVVFLYTLLCIGLQLLIWFVPSLIGNAVAISFVGFFLGPMYPIAMNQSKGIFPPWILTESLGWIAGFGQAGSAFLPFLTGAMASKVGIWSLQPFTIGMMTFMMGLWYLVPNQVRPLD